MRNLQPRMKSPTHLLSSRFSEQPARTGRGGDNFRELGVAAPAANLQKNWSSTALPVEASLSSNAAAAMVSSENPPTRCRPAPSSGSRATGMNDADIRFFDLVDAARTEDRRPSSMTSDCKPLRFHRRFVFAVECLDVAGTCGAFVTRERSNSGAALSPDSDPIFRYFRRACGHQGYVHPRLRASQRG